MAKAKQKATTEDFVNLSGFCSSKASAHRRVQRSSGAGEDQNLGETGSGLFLLRNHRVPPQAERRRGRQEHQDQALRGKAAGSGWMEQEQGTGWKAPLSPVDTCVRVRACACVCVGMHLASSLLGYLKPSDLDS